ncbi:MAG: FAD-binding oxidoreductase [Candidatus Heimdallarchaeota archaeon]|nr:MAG: FAD-binding oxidoreductase [Candidatus Heimdallarchaeota archaeon]
MTAYDCIIVGAGSVGVPTALAMGKEGLKTLVLDSAPSVGCGDNKHAIGGIRATHSHKGKIWVCQRSIEIFSKWEEKFGDDIEWIQGGYSFVAYNDSDEKLLKDNVQLQKRYGLNIDYHEAEKIKELIPGINGDGLLGGTFSPEDGNASPLLAINAFYRQARNFGVLFKFKEEVIGVRINKKQIVSIKTLKETFQTQCIINAAGAHARDIAQMVGSVVPVTPDSHEAGITEPVKRFFTPMIVDIRPSEGSKNYYFYQNREGKIIFCLTPHPPIVGTDRRETSVFLPQIAKRMINLLPRLKNIKVRRTWRGLYPMTPDGCPIVGPINEINGYINAVGMCGQGYMIGPGVGEVLARLVAEKCTLKDQEILEEFSLYRDFAEEEKLK